MRLLLILDLYTACDTADFCNQYLKRDQDVFFFFRICSKNIESQHCIKMSFWKCRHMALWKTWNGLEWNGVDFNLLKIKSCDTIQKIKKSFCCYCMFYILWFKYQNNLYNNSVYPIQSIGMPDTIKQEPLFIFPHCSIVLFFSKDASCF